MQDRMGSMVLQEILNEHLGQHIKEKLPAISNKFKITLREIENELEEKGYYGQMEEEFKTKYFKR